MKPMRWVAGVVLGAVLATISGDVRAAKGPPPTRDDLIGTWAVTFKGTRIDTTNGAVTKFAETATWTVIPGFSPDRILVQDFGSGLGEDYDALYFAGSGMFMIAAHLDQTRAGYAAVTGTPGNLRIKGVFGLRDDGANHRLEFTTFSGTWTGTLVPAKPAPAAPGTSRGPLAAKVPPAAGDLDGADFAVAIGLKGYEFLDGAKGGAVETAHWTLQNLGGGDFAIHMDDGGGTDVVPARYVNGILYVGAGDDPGIASEAVVAAIFVSGTPGKLKLKGYGVQVRNEGEDHWGATMKLAGREVAD